MGIGVRSDIGHAERSHTGSDEKTALYREVRPGLEKTSGALETGEEERDC